MSDNAISRRMFLAGSTGLATAAAAASGLGLTGCSAPYTVYDAESSRAPIPQRQSQGVCTACPYLCSYTAYVKQDQVATLIAHTASPNSCGKLCARGFAYSRCARASNRLASPLKRDSNGGFTEVGWEEALTDIATRMVDVPASSIMVLHSSEPTAAFYGDRLARVLGSGLSRGSSSDYSPSHLGGTAQVMGADITGWDVDTRNCRLLLQLGTPAHGFSPAQLQRLGRAQDSGCTIVYAGPVRDGVASHASTWIPTLPGSELGLLLALAHELLERKLYNASYVKKHVEGFDTFADAMGVYSAAWCAETCSIPEETVIQLATQLADAAPACAVAADGGFGQGLPGSGETARMVCIINSLLGVWNQKGGAYLRHRALPSELGELELDQVAGVTSDGASAYGSTLTADAAPLAPARAAGTAAALASDAVQHLFVLGCDPVLEEGNSTQLGQLLENKRLAVVADWYMSESARHADYVLPLCTELEHDALPAFVDGRQPTVSISNRAVEPSVEQARPVSKLVADLAGALGHGEAFEAGVDGFADALLKDWGISVDQLRRIGSSGASRTGASSRVAATGSTDNGAAASTDLLPKLTTPSGRIEFASSACEAAGLGAAPGWIDLDVIANSGCLYGYVVPLACQTNSRSAATPGMSVLAETYEAGRVLINPADAQSRGLEDGAAVLLSSADGTEKAHISLAERVMPGVVAIPVAFGPDNARTGGLTAGTAAKSGAHSNDREVAQDRPVASALVSGVLELGYGSPVTRFAKVTIQKAGA